MIKTIINRLRARRQDALRRELELRAADQIYLTDRDGTLIVCFRGVAVYMVGPGDHRESVSLEEAMHQLCRLRHEYVAAHITGRT